jgi:hypothetical protein
MIRIELNERELNNILSRYSEETILKAQRRSISRVASRVVTTISREIRKEYNLKARDIKKHIKTLKRSDGLVVEVDEKNYKLIQFNAVRTVRESTIPKVKIKKNQTATALPMMFYAVMQSGHMGIYMRGRAMEKKGINYGSRTYKRVKLSTNQKEVEELAINEMVAMDTADMVDKLDIEDKVLEVFKDNFQSEVIRLLTRNVIG